MEDYNTYNADGFDAVEENYKEQFSGTGVGIAFQNLDMMRHFDRPYQQRLVGCAIKPLNDTTTQEIFFYILHYARAKFWVAFFGILRF